MSVIIGNDNESTESNKKLATKFILNVVAVRRSTKAFTSSALRLRPVYFENLPQTSVRILISFNSQCIPLQVQICWNALLCILLNVCQLKVPIQGGWMDGCIGPLTWIQLKRPIISNSRHISHRPSYSTNGGAT